MTGLALFCTKTAQEFRRLLVDERGATAIEYALVAGGIACAIAATVFSLGTAVKQNLYQKISDAFQ
jgi:pilus assembly protein Flp/PilA